MQNNNKFRHTFRNSDHRCACTDEIVIYSWPLASLSTCQWWWGMGDRLAAIPILSWTVQYIVLIRYVCKVAVTLRCK